MKQESKKDPILVQYIKDRVLNKNKNFLMIFIGETGSGKSYAAIRLAEMLDSTFNIDRCCFKAKDFMNKINELVDKSEEGEDISGRVILWDELGVENSSREFMTISNRVINYFFQTCRSLNLVVLMTVPFLSFVDTSTRKLAHSFAEMQSINYKEKTSTVKVKMVQTNPITGKIYPKYLRYNHSGKRYVLKKAKMKLPDKELMNEYESKKKQYQINLNNKIERTLSKMEEKNKEKDNDKKPLTEKQEYYKEQLKKKSAKEIAADEGISLSGVYAHKTNMEKKGYKFRPIYDDKKVVRYEVLNE